MNKRFGVILIGGLLVSGAFLGLSFFVSDSAEAKLNFTSQPCYEDTCCGGGPPPSFYTLEVTKIGSGTVTSDLAGIDCGATCTAAYVPGEIVTLTATPAEGWSFYRWIGVCIGAGQCPVTMNTNKSITAQFLPVVTVDAVGPGTVTSSPAGISCGAACSSTFDYGSSVTLTAIPSQGNYFYGWTGDCSGTGSCNLTMNSGKYAIAWFGNEEEARFLQVQLLGAPFGGEVNSTPSGISCAWSIFNQWYNCMGFFPLNSLVTLTASHDEGHFFGGWGGPCSGTDLNCVVAMDDNHGVTASFYRISQLTLNVHKDPNFSNGGSVFVDNPGANCTAEGTCVYEYQIVGTADVTLTANPDDGSTWYWGQACSGTGSQCTVSVGNGNTTTVDIYYIPHVVLNVLGQGAGGGEVEVSEGKPSCAAIPPPQTNTCVYSFPGGTFITLTPHPEPGYTFAWYQYCEGSGATCSFNAWPGETWTADIHFFLE